METTLAPVKNRNNDRVAFLVREMKRRKKMCEMKLKKLESRIKVLDAFQNLPPNKKMSLSDFLKSRNLRMSDIFSPMGYYCPMNMVVSSDKENNYLTYNKGFESNADAGFPTPKREIVANKEHREVMSSFYGMTWNPALNRYFPTTPFDANTYANADGDADLGMDIMGGFSMQDLANLNNKNSDARKLTKEVRDYVVEEYDNVEGEYETINQALNKIYYGDNYSSADGDSSNKEKRDKRGDARKDFRKDKRACKDKRNRGELTNLEYTRCVEQEKEEKKQAIDENAGFGRKAVRFATRFTPITALGRGGALLLIQMNAFGYATRLAPALLPDAEAQNLFKPESIQKAKNGWIKTQRAWKNLGGKPEKLKEAILKGYKKKPKKSEEIKSTEDVANVENVEKTSNLTGLGEAALITAGTGVLTSLIGLVGKIVDKNPYKGGKTPPNFQQGLNDGSVENPPLDPNAPAINQKGEWIDPKTGEKINPQTGKLDDRIFGLNKYLALGIGVAGVVALYYLFKRK
jgi:hypothetical protein